MNRRALVKRLMIMSTGILLKPGLLLSASKNTKMIDPLDPLSFITTGADVFNFILGMFNTGPGIADLIAKMDNKLDVINSKLSYISQQIDDVKASVDNIGQTVVVEDLKNMISANISRYRAHMSAFYSPSYGGKMRTYMRSRKNRNLVQEIVSSVVGVKSRIYQVNDPVPMLPYCSLAVFIQYQLKYEFQGYKPKELLADLTEDINQLQSILFKKNNNLVSQLSAARAKRGTYFLNSETFLAEVRKSDDLRVFQLLYNYQLQKVYTNDWGAAENIKLLADEGMITVDDQPLQLKPVQTKRIAMLAEASDLDNYRRAGRILYTADFGRSMTDQVAQIESNIAAGYDKYNAELMGIYNLTIMLASCKLAGLTALKVCKQYLSKV